MDIHSEREMCGMCSATSNFMMANLSTHLPAIHELLAKSSRDSRRPASTQTLVTSSHNFPNRAPAVPPSTPGITTRAHTLDPQNPAPPRASAVTDFDD